MAGNRRLMTCLMLMSAIAVSYGFGVYLFPALIPMFRHDLPVGYSTIGLLLSTRQVGFLVTSLAAGALANRFGCVKLVTGSCAVVCLGLAALGMAPNITVVALALIVLNCAAASVWIPMVPIVAAEIPEDRQAQALGFIASGTNYGVFANGLLMTTVIPLLGWRGTFAVTTIVAVAVLLGVVSVFRRSGIHHRAEAAAVQADSLPARTLPAARSSIFQPRYVVLAIVAFLGGLGGIPFISYWSSFGVEELHLARGLVGGAWTTIGILGMASGFIMGWLADRHGIRAALSGAVVGLGAAAGVAVALHNSAGFVSASLLFGLTFFPIYGLIPTYIAKTADRRQAPLISGVTEGALGLGAICGSLAGAAIRAHTGEFNTVYTAIAAVCCLMLIFVGCLRSEETPNTRNSARAAR